MIQQDIELVQGLEKSARKLGEQQEKVLSMVDDLLKKVETLVNLQVQVESKIALLNIRVESLEKERQVLEAVKEVRKFEVCPDGKCTYTF